MFWIWLAGAVMVFMVGGLPAIQGSQDDEPVANELTVLYVVLGLLWPIVLVVGLVAFAGVKFMDYREQKEFKAKKL